MSKKILITVGGTGGHIFPAIALGKQLSQADSTIDLLYVGGNLTANPYFEREAFPHQSVSCATFKRKNPWALLKTTGKIALGIGQSYKILKDYSPDLVVGFGSYYTLPILLAARLIGIPIILHEANSIPGKVNRLLSRQAKVTGIHFPDTAQLLKGKTMEVGLPLRPGYNKGTCSKEKAREYFDLDASRFTILVFGGSQGAVNLNRLVKEAFIDHLSNYKDQWQIIHLVGDTSLAQILRTEYQKAGIKACVKAFESCMDLAWQAADISIARAGAGTIAEQLEFEVPGVLVPYPYAMDNHQDKNADFLAKTVGGAIKCKEADLTPKSLAQEVESFYGERRQKMSAAMHEYKIKCRHTNFCNLILGLEELTE